MFYGEIRKNILNCPLLIWVSCENGKDCDSGWYEYYACHKTPYFDVA